MSKFTKDHPAFQRTEDFIQAQILKCRPSAVAIAMRGVNRLLIPNSESLIRQVADRVDEIENRMAKKMRRYYGLNGKYVGH